MASGDGVVGSGARSSRITAHRLSAADVRSKEAPTPRRRKRLQTALSEAVPFTQRAWQQVVRSGSPFKRRPLPRATHRSSMPLPANRLAEMVRRIPIAIINAWRGSARRSNDQASASWDCNRGKKCHFKRNERPAAFLDFRKLAEVAQSRYVWQAERPLQPESMLGLAGFMFMLKRRGVVMLRNYFIPNMFGGHIDLWNEIQTGNNFADLPTENFHGWRTRFFQLRHIAFWPSD